MGGKHVVLQAPVNSGSEYFNYKSTFSIVLFALVDANYSFLCADVGCRGRISDRGVFRNTTLFKNLGERNLNQPDLKPLEGRQKPVPYVFVADDAFTLHDNIMKPYPGSQEKGSTKRSFNRRLSRARRTVENVFEIMSSVFRVLRKPLLLQPDKAQLIVLDFVHLHNYLKKNSSSKRSYLQNGMLDIEQNGRIGNWRNEGQTRSMLPIQRVARKPSNTYQSIRDEFAEYFATNGKVPWQDNV